MEQLHQQVPSRAERVMLFARNFFKHPKMLGSLIPSSRFLVEGILARVDWNRARVIVEFGPGVGTFTTEILRRMPADGKLILFETNREFVRLLKRSLPDPRVEVRHQSAGDIGEVLKELGLRHADYVISGIPFSTLPPGVRQSILRNTYEAIAPDGAFLVYQFSAEVLRHLRPLFRQVEVDFELLNVLPARIFVAKK